MSILERLQKEVLIYDGAMGTLLQASGVLKPGSAPEALNLTHRDIVAGIHTQYVDAGADIIETNTFGGARLKLKQFGLDSKFKDINAQAVQIAKSVIHTRGGYVAAGIGPLEQMVEPLGPISFEDAVAAYKEWVEVVTNAGCDILLFETFSDIRELKAAIIAAREITSDIPIQVQLTYDGGEQTVSGTAPDVAAVTLSAMDVQIIGTNCSTGPEDLVKVVDAYYRFSDKYVSVLPNAGMPELINNKMVFKATPESMAAVAHKFIESGANIIGGCCGTTPAHIAAIARVAKRYAPLARKKIDTLQLSSRTQLFRYEEKKRPFVIGERINPTGKKMLSEELVEGRTNLIRRYAIEQTRKGATLLDVNVGAAGCDERVMMKKAVRAVQSISQLPLVIDSVDPEVLEIGLREVAGKPLINSVNGEEKNITTVLALARKYGAAVLGLTTDEQGIPHNKEERMAIVGRIADAACNRFNIAATDIVIDPLALTLASESHQAKETLETIDEIKEKYGFFTSLGVSNISFGLPDRARVNADFLSLAVAYGLDFAIANPNDESLMGVVAAQARAEKGEDAIATFVQDALTITSSMPSKEKKQGEARKEYTKEDMPAVLHEAILYGDKDEIEFLIECALKHGMPAYDINVHYLVPALEEVGRRFEKKEFFLPHVIMAAETMQLAFQRLKKEMQEDAPASKGKIVFATVEGDFHDIGKNIVIAVLENYGYEIVDLGKNVTATQIVTAAHEHNADIVGLSALMTTTMIKMDEVISLLREQGNLAKTMVGGAVLTEKYAETIGADAYARNAIEAVTMVKNLLGQ